VVGAVRLSLVKKVLTNNMEQQSHLFDEIKASTRLQMAKEILKGIKGLNLSASTTDQITQIVKDAQEGPQ